MIVGGRAKKFGLSDGRLGVDEIRCEEVGEVLLTGNGEAFIPV